MKLILTNINRLTMLPEIGLFCMETTPGAANSTNAISTVRAGQRSPTNSDAVTVLSRLVRIVAGSLPFEWQCSVR